MVFGKNTYSVHPLYLFDSAARKLVCCGLLLIRMCSKNSRGRDSASGDIEGQPDEDGADGVSNELRRGISWKRAPQKVSDEDAAPLEGS